MKGTDMKMGTALVVEDDDSCRVQIVKWLTYYEYFVLEANCMKMARDILLSRYEEIKLIVMDVILPENEEKANSIKELLKQRENAYAKWLVQDEVCTDEYIEWQKARFGVDILDRKIFSLLDLEGGINLMYDMMKIKGDTINKPVIYLTAREEQSLRREGIGIINKGRSFWLVKPTTEEEFYSAVNVLSRFSG